MLYRSQEYIDIPFDPLVVLVQWLIQSVGKAKGDTNHPAWEFVVDCRGGGRWFPCHVTGP